MLFYVQLISLQVRLNVQFSSVYWVTNINIVSISANAILTHLYQSGRGLRRPVVSHNTRSLPVTVKTLDKMLRLFNTPAVFTIE